VKAVDDAAVVPGAVVPVAAGVTAATAVVLGLEAAVVELVWLVELVGLVGMGARPPPHAAEAINTTRTGSRRRHAADRDRDTRRRYEDRPPDVTMTVKVLSPAEQVTRTEST
jgi:hypothetical protein